MRLAAAHGTRVRFYDDVVESASIEDLAIRPVMLVVSHIEAARIKIERVRILHDELADSQQTGFRPRLIAKLCLNLIPDLRQLLITTQLATSNGCDDLLMSHSEAHVTPKPVFETKHVVAHYIPAAGFLPQLC